jgi:two-component system cell cycle response regulator DivK
MDVGLPGMDGLAAVEILQNDPATSSINIVVVTAHAMRGDRKKHWLWVVLAISPSR